MGSFSQFDAAFHGDLRRRSFSGSAVSRIASRHQLRGGEPSWIRLCPSVQSDGMADGNRAGRHLARRTSAWCPGRRKAVARGRRVGARSTPRTYLWWMEDADRDIIGKTFARRSTFFGVAYEPSRHPNGYSSPDKARCGSFRKVPTDGVIGRPSLWIAEDFGGCGLGW